jgi:hypothetical protein
MCDDLVGLHDIMPTLIHGLGLEYPLASAPLPGESLLRRSGIGLGCERERILGWERRQGFSESFDDDGRKTFPEPPVPDTDSSGGYDERRPVAGEPTHGYAG